MTECMKCERSMLKAHLVDGLCIDCRPTKKGRTPFTRRD